MSKKNKNYNNSPKQEEMNEPEDVLDFTEGSEVKEDVNTDEPKVENEKMLHDIVEDVAEVLEDGALQYNLATPEVVTSENEVHTETFDIKVESKSVLDTHYAPGKVVKLKKPVKVYPTAVATTVCGMTSGEVYMYDGKLVNGRYKITSKRSIEKKFIIGYIDKTYI